MAMTDQDFVQTVIDSLPPTASDTKTFAASVATLIEVREREHRPLTGIDVLKISVGYFVEMETRISALEEAIRTNGSSPSQ